MKKLDKQGGHMYMSPDEIESWYRKLEGEYKTNLAQYGVKFPAKNSIKALCTQEIKKLVLPSI